MTYDYKQSPFIRILMVAAIGCVPLPSLAAGAVVVSASSPAGAMTAEQVAQLFLGKSATLPGGTAAVLIDQSEGAAIRDEFYTKVAGKNAAQIKAVWSRLAFSGAAQPPKVVASDAEIKKAVAGTPGAIGYIDKSAVDSSVKVLLSFE